MRIAASKPRLRLPRATAAVVAVPRLQPPLQLVHVALRSLLTDDLADVLRFVLVNPHQVIGVGRSRRRLHRLEVYRFSRRISLAAAAACCRLGYRFGPR